MYISWNVHCEYKELEVCLIFVQIYYVATSHQLLETKVISTEILKYIYVKGRVPRIASVTIYFSIYEKYFQAGRSV
jgi:hypothetical protein